MSQREKQPRLVRFTLTRRNFEGLRNELQRRGLDDDPRALGFVLNELIARGLGAPASASPPPAAPPAPGPLPDDPDDAWETGFLTE